MKISRVDLHIGHEKTGSSSIQAALRSSRKTLRGQGVLYPSGLGGASHLSLAVIGLALDEHHELHQLVGVRNSSDLQQFRDATTAALTHQIRSAVRPSRLVLSSEHCASRLLEGRQIERLHDWLTSTTGCSDVRVLIYLRRQDRMLESRFSTALQNGRTRPLGAPTAEEFQRYCDYGALLRRWSDQVGRDKIRVRLFEAAKLHGNDVVADFFHTLALGAPPDNLPPRLNASLGGAQQTMLLAFNRHIMEDWARRNRWTAAELPLSRDVPTGPEVDAHAFARELLAPITAAIPAATDNTPPARLTRATAEELLDRCQEGNRWVGDSWLDNTQLFAPFGKADDYEITAAQIAVVAAQALAAARFHERRHATKPWWRIARGLLTMWRTVSTRTRLIRRRLAPSRGPHVPRRDV